MAFDNHYPNRKDHRKPYYHSQRFDRSCRPGGNCPYCINNRTYQARRELERTDWELRSRYDDIIAMWERSEIDYYEFFWESD